jgi:hypothetical protein
VRSVAIILLAILLPAVVFGIFYVPRHDGELMYLLLLVLLPTAVVCWCIRQLLPSSSRRG